MLALLRTLRDAEKVVHLDESGLPKYAAAIAVELWRDGQTFDVKVCTQCLDKSLFLLLPNTCAGQLSRRHILWLSPSYAQHRHMALDYSHGYRL